MKLFDTLVSNLKERSEQPLTLSERACLFMADNTDKESVLTKSKEDVVKALKKEKYDNIKKVLQLEEVNALGDLVDHTFTLLIKKEFMEQKDNRYILK